MAKASARTIRCVHSRLQLYPFNGSGSSSKFSVNVGPHFSDPPGTTSSSLSPSSSYDATLFTSNVGFSAPTSRFLLTSLIQSKFFLSKSAPLNGNISQAFFHPKHNPFIPQQGIHVCSFYRSPVNTCRNCLPVRYLSFWASNNGNIAKTVVDKPVSALRSAFARYREAVGLHVEAFWKRNYLVLLGAGGVASCIILWRVMFGIANTFVGLSEGMAKYGFLALSTAIISFCGLYARSRFTINPDKVYRIAMRKLNTSAGILEVMGAPLSGTDLRAYIMSGGGLTLKNFKPRLDKKRCFLIFPIRGSERKGLVSVEVKKKKGQVWCSTFQPKSFHMLCSLL